jgi:sugar lactone lactonase YvrE
MSLPSRRLLSATLSAALLATTSALNAQAGAATHAMATTIKITWQNQPALLNTFCLDEKGNLLAACGGSKAVQAITAAGRTTKTQQQPNQIRVFSPKGENLANLDVDIVPQAIHVGTDGRIYVGGDGRLLVLDNKGAKLADAKIEGPQKRGTALRITGIAVSARDVFVAASARTGTGYEVWRMGLDLGAGQCILAGQRGCCGQFDIQARGDELVVADNTRHRVSRYDRDGKELGGFGKSSRDGGEGFGGCCNPMNTCIGANGEIYTAESEGIIKCFSADGKKIATVGTVELAGGCKHVAIEVSKDGERIYVADITGGAIAVMHRQGRSL